MPPSASEKTSSSFFLLDERIQRWVWEKGWTSLRDAQERAIPAIVHADHDVIIAAATAAGKTEAAFLPILTHLLHHKSETGCVLYISPLKALINDQWGRLESLCEDLDIPVIPWHGDISANRKHKFLKSPRGVLLITPESLEAMFVRRGHDLKGLFSPLRYVVVDELHAFIGSERGKQLQSLLHRLENVIGRNIPRIGLSATLGDMKLASEFLRPSDAESVEIIVSEAAGQGLMILVRGLEDIAPGSKAEAEAANEVAASKIADYLFNTLRGTNNLVFPNRRERVEFYSDVLRRRCEQEGMPNEFWPHHGSLSKDAREKTEQALKKGYNPATAICTTTLELGIDIGSVKSIAQIGPPPSVASLRQRLGRSGRREGESAILRAYCVEPTLTAGSGLSDRIREELVQTIASISLLLVGWFEPPRVQGLHASTLVQQILSLIAQRGGIQAADAWRILARDGPFAGLEKGDFVALLRELGSRDLITQDSSGLILHGVVGGKLVNHHDFYCAFKTEDEFRVAHQGEIVGSLPLSRPLQPQNRIILAGRRWCVVEVDDDRKIIWVLPDPGGTPPAFDGDGFMVHDRVREEMRAVLASEESIAFLDAEGRVLLEEARRYYRDAKLAECCWMMEGGEVLLLTWKGDRVNDALALMLFSRGLLSGNAGVAVAVRAESKDVLTALGEIARAEVIDLDDLLADVTNLKREKWDWALPAALLRKSFASSALDLQGARTAAQELLEKYRSL